MWIWFALISSVLLGFYDVAKKNSVEGNAVLPVLTLATSISALFFLPVILSSEFGLGWFAEGSPFYVVPMGLEQHLLVALKAVIVAATWLFGYLAVKYLPLTIVSPISLYDLCWCCSARLSSLARGSISINGLALWWLLRHSI